MKIIECPRDAMQGLHQFIPTQEKVAYINQLLKVGFDTIDFGSFVSPKAIPQLRDTTEVLANLDISSSKSKLLAIVANLRGATEASVHSEIHYLGFPLSLSETFQKRNTNKSIDEAMIDLAEMQEICQKKGKILVVYLSMGFGNPYGDPYQMDYVANFVAKLDKIGVQIISLADTIGVATAKIIAEVFTQVANAYSHVEFGVHLHAQPNTAGEKLLAAYDAGCRRIDGAILGIGGCPMANDKLTGNIATEQILALLAAKGNAPLLDMDAWQLALTKARQLFGND